MRNSNDFFYRTHMFRKKIGLKAQETHPMDAKTRIKELIDELSKRLGLVQTTISNMWKRNT